MSMDLFQLLFHVPTESCTHNNQISETVDMFIASLHMS